MTSGTDSLNFGDNFSSLVTIFCMTVASSEGGGSVMQSMDGKNIFKARATLSLGFSSKPPLALGCRIRS